MNSGSVRGAAKPINTLAHRGLVSGWLRAGGSHDVQSFLTTVAHQQDEYPDATDPRCPLFKIGLAAYLTEESIPGCLPKPAKYSGFL